MPSPTHAKLFARAFQSQVARHPGATCLTLPILQAQRESSARCDGSDGVRNVACNR
jgi:hypothetical protein